MTTAQPPAAKKPKLAHSHPGNHATTHATDERQTLADRKSDVAYIVAKLGGEIGACDSDGEKLAAVLKRYQNLLCDAHHAADSRAGLADALRAGDARVVRYMLAKGVSARFRSKTGVSPFAHMCWTGRLDIAKLLRAYSTSDDSELFYGDAVSPLSYAARGGHLEVVEWLLEIGMAVDTRDKSSSMTPLLVAASRGFTRIVRRLVAAGADARLADNSRNRVRTLSARNGQLTVLRYLVEHNIGAVDDKGRPVNTLRSAATCGHEHIVRYIIETGEFIRTDATTSLPFAIRARNAEIAELLIRNGADVYFSDDDARGKASLYLAIEAKMVDTVRLMLSQNGVDLNKLVSRDGFNALHALAETGDMEMLTLAKSYMSNEDVDINAVTSMRSSIHMCGCTALTLACANGHTDAVRFLLTEFSSSIDVDLFDDISDPPLTAAASRGSVEIMELLLSSGASVNPHENVVAPLCGAAGAGHIDAVRFLCEHGAVVNPPAGIHTALHYAVEKNHSDIIAYLIEEWGADASHLGNAGISVFEGALNHTDTFRVLMSYDSDIDSSPDLLCYAAMYGNLDTVKVLVKYGVDVNAKYHAVSNLYDLVVTPVMAAALAGHVEVVEYLCQQGADLELTSEQNESAVHLAAMMGKTSVLEYLVKIRHMDLHAKTTLGFSPADIAAVSGGDGGVQGIAFLIFISDSDPRLRTREASRESGRTASVEYWERHRTWKHFLETNTGNFRNRWD